MLQTSHALFLPILAQMLLTILVYISLARTKAAALKSGTADLQRTALHADAWPESVIKVNNNLRNQFELPVLFYVVCFVLAATGAAGPVVQVLAWLFVASRAVHAWVHTHSNYVPIRLRAFAAGVVILVALWVIALVRLL
jgi:hypothetical protein